MMVSRAEKGQRLVSEHASLTKECSELRLLIKEGWTTASVQDMQWRKGRLFECENRLKRIEASKFWVTTA